MSMADSHVDHDRNSSLSSTQVYSASDLTDAVKMSSRGF